jgi:hypothetical protein
MVTGSRKTIIRDLQRLLQWFVYTGCILIFSHSGVTFAQFLDQGGITGIVQDQTGAVVPGAQVTLTSTDTGLQLHATTNGSGAYVFSPITIGHYKVSVSAPGFQTATQENLTVNMGARLNIPFKLTPGTVNQSVTVTTAPALLQTQESSVGQIVTTEQINDTPLNGRNWVFMVQLTPGAVPSDSRAKGSGDFNANGLRAEQNDFILDGMDNKTITVDYLGGSSYLVSPPPDALAEFQVTTADYSAEFGHSAGAVVDASIKSGTNQIHGDLWEYWRNNILDARDFDALTIPEFRENLFGATLGLPIIKNRLFFFGDVQANRIAAGQPYTQNVPTLLERQGNFTELLNPSLTGESKPVTLYEPNSGGTAPLVYNGQQNVFGPNQIDPVAQNILKLYPLPNANNGKTYANNVQNLSQPENTFQWDTRVDYDITQKDQAFARFSYNNSMGNYAGPLGPILDGSCGEGSDCVSGLQVNYGNSFVASETHIFTPTLVNELRFGYDYGHFDTYQLNFTKDIATTLGLGGMPFGKGYKDNGGLPQIGIAGIAQAGTHAYRPEEEFENEYEILDNVSKTLGRHTLKLGGSAQSIRSYTLEAPVGHGAYNFSGFFTSANGAAFTGNGQADFLADQMNSGQIGPSTPFNDAQWNISGYAQDDWRTTQRLTLNLGLRYDWFQPYKEMAGRQASFFPTGTPGLSTGSGTLSYPIQDQGKLPFSAAFLQNLATDNIKLQYSSRPALTKEQVLNFSPRVGFAYSIYPTTVLRGGFGMFYQGEQNAGAALNLGTNYPFVFGDSFPSPTCNPKAPPCLSDGYTLEQGFQSIINQGLSTFLANPSLNGMNTNLKTTYAMDYNLTLQRAFTNNLVGTIGYVGTAGRHLPYNMNPNDTAVLASPGVNLQPLLPFPQFGGFSVLDYEGISSYNSLQTKLEKRMANGLDFLATYVWGHALDDASEPLGGTVGYRDVNIIPVRQEYSNSGWDTRHRFTINGYYQLPFGAGTGHVIHSRAMNSVLGGWATNLTFQVQTGQPFTVGIADITPATGGAKRAIVVRNPFVGGGSPDPTNPTITCPAKVRTLQHWYNPCAFRNPLPGTLIPKGTYVSGAAAVAYLGGRSNTVYGPGFNRLDMSLFKNFPTFRQQFLQFRVDVFNLANTPEWADPSNSSDGQTGGLITSARTGQVYTPDARFFQLSAKYVF